MSRPDDALHHAAKKPSTVAVLSDYGIETAAALTAILFFTGWQYAHAYFGTFGIGLVSQLEVDVTYYLVWAFAPLMAIKWWIVGIVILASASRSIVLKYIPAIQLYATKILIVLVLLAFWGTSWVARSVGSEHGLRDIDAGTTLLPVVKVTLRDSELAKRISLLPAHPLAESTYLLLGHHRSIYLLVRASYAGGLQVGAPRVILVPDEVIATVEIVSLKEDQSE